MEASGKDLTGIPPGFLFRPGLLDAAEQRALLEDVAAIARAAPFVRPMTPWGKPMTVRMTSAGAFGWVTDRRGYRYEPAHPETGEPWPPIPERVLALWRLFAGDEVPPDSCLVNHYSPKARMGLHQDKDEADFSVPVVSISLGDPAVFRIGGLKRKDPTRSFTLSSGDVVVLGGAARLAYHGVDRVKPGSTLLEGHPEFQDDGGLGGGRINLTLRRVAPLG